MCSRIEIKNGDYIGDPVADRRRAHCTWGESIAASTSGRSISFGKILRKYVQCKSLRLFHSVRLFILCMNWWIKTIESSAASTTWMRVNNYVMFLCERHTLDVGGENLFDITSLPQHSHCFDFVVENIKFCELIFNAENNFSFSILIGIHALSRRIARSATMSEGRSWSDQLCIEFFPFNEEIVPCRILAVRSLLGQE